MPGYHRGRLRLFGDAALVQPFTGSGVFKASKNAIDLAEQFGAHDEAEAALQAWDRDETASGKRLMVLGEQMEKAFIWEPPNFAPISEAEAAAWWTAGLGHVPRRVQLHGLDRLGLALYGVA
jgi:2-polyprenyl-6-methoxyphenol hydroxylase-like FAD-dependent oxidoreductase